MKIVQVMPDFGLAGAETMVENLSCGLAAEGCDVLVISFFDLHTAITERIENRGIKIKYLGKKRGFDPSIISKMRKIINGCIRCITLLRKNRQKLEKILIEYYSAILMWFL